MFQPYLPIRSKVNSILGCPKCHAEKKNRYEYYDSFHYLRVKWLRIVAFFIYLHQKLAQTNNIHIGLFEINSKQFLSKRRYHSAIMNTMMTPPLRSTCLIKCDSIMTVMIQRHIALLASSVGVAGWPGRGSRPPKRRPKQHRQ